MISIPKRNLTLPAVEGGFGSLNILRDPPASLQTYYRPKVGSDNRILEWVDGAGDRICESILPFARGKNPMVAVNYSNYGSDGGLQSNYAGGISQPGSQNLVKGGSGKLPYRILREGAFRPPILSPRELLPLSRLPRLPTAQFSNPGSEVSAAKEATIQKMYCKKDFREVRSDVLRTIIEPTKLYNLTLTAEPSYQVSSMLNPNMVKLIDIEAPRSEMKMALLESNQNPAKGITSISRPTTSAYALASMRKDSTSEQVQNLPIIVSPLKPQASTNLSDPTRNVQIERQLPVLKVTTPIAQAFTNQSRVGDNPLAENSSREFKRLARKGSCGSYTVGGTMPGSFIHGRS